MAKNAMPSASPGSVRQREYTIVTDEQAHSGEVVALCGGVLGMTVW